ncbi:MAG: DUF4173 domain-containing protein [Clostridia bacterium]|nr:DUF4173 domain-containing protein [Clostridia bacterium]
MKENKIKQLSAFDVIAAPITFILTHAFFTKLFVWNYEWEFGICYLLIFIFATIYISSKTGFKKTAVFPAAVAILITLSVFLHGMSELFFLALVFLIFVSGYYCLCLTGCAKNSSGSYFFLLDIFRSEVSVPWLNIFLPLFSLKTLKKDTNKNKRLLDKKTLSIALGMLCAIPVLLVVVPLLLDSDAAFESVMGTAFSKIRELLEKFFENNISSFWNDFLFNFLFIFPFSLIFAPYIFSVMFSFRHGVYRDDYKNTAPSFSSLRKVSVSVFCGFLGVISIVYLVYLFSQTAYFFSAFSGQLPNGMKITVTEYARRGFFEMAKIAGVNLCLIAVSVLFSKRNGAKLHRAVRYLCLFLSVFTVILISTSVSKIILYMAQMGLTEKRIYVFLFDIVLIVTFVAVIIRLFRESFPYMKVILSFACIVFTLLNLVNVRGIIASYNTQMFLEGKIEAEFASDIYNYWFNEIEHLDKLAQCDNKIISTQAKYKIGSDMVGMFEKGKIVFNEGDITAVECFDQYKAMIYCKENEKRFFEYYKIYKESEEDLYNNLTDLTDIENIEVQK